MKKKTSAIVLFVIIGAFGLTFGYFYMTKPESLNPTLLFLMKPPPPPRPKMWIWVSGSDTRNIKGTYGTKGVAAAENIPGARHKSVSWTDSNNNLWLFGGYGYDGAGSLGYLNDLWMFDITSGWWTWVAGNDTKNQNGTYGTKGVAAAGNIPGARWTHVSWTDSDDNLWLFGGYGNDTAGVFGKINDLWMFNITSGWWTWVSGNDTINQNGTYGTKGVAAAGNIPGARGYSVSWMGSDDTLWLFGGLGRDSAGSSSDLNDLWMFNITSGWWTWVAGNDTVNQNGTYGTKGVPAAENVPGARRVSGSLTGSDDTLWLFGGLGRDSAGSFGYLNDMWMFNITSRWWTWMSGNDTIIIKGTYGTMGVPAAENVPGARGGITSWTDADDNLWLFGGYGWDSAGIGEGPLNDMWMFNITSRWWTWVAGSDTWGQAGIYGTKGVPAADNIPGARDQCASWTDSYYNLWLFGGNGLDGASNGGELNDLWIYC